MRGGRRCVCDVPLAPMYWPPSPCGAGGMAVERSRSRRGLAPSPCGAGGMAPPLPLRRGGQAPFAPVASVRQWPHRRWCEHAHDVIVTCASTRSEHGIPGPRRRQPRSPAAAVSNSPGCRPDERLSSRPRGAGWSEAVRGTGVPRAAEGAVELRTSRIRRAFERQSSAPARVLAPSPCGAGGMAPPTPLRRGGQARCVPVASVRQWPHRRWWYRPRASASPPRWFNDPVWHRCQCPSASSADPGSARGPSAPGAVPSW